MCRRSHRKEKQPHIWLEEVKKKWASLTSPLVGPSNWVGCPVFLEAFICSFCRNWVASLGISQTAFFTQFGSVSISFTFPYCWLPFLFISHHSLSFGQLFRCFSMLQVSVCFSLLLSQFTSCKIFCFKSGRGYSCVKCLN